MSSCPAVCLSIAGSDSGGGAGIQADLRAFADFDCFGLSVVTVITAQNPQELRSIQVVSVAQVVAQYEAVRGFSIGAIKTGMLFSDAIIEAVAMRLGAAAERPPLVVDPVMLASSGAPLIDPGAVASLSARLLPLAAVVTPNLPELAALTGRDAIEDEREALHAAAELAGEAGSSVLVKGGHRPGASADDLLVTGDGRHRLSAPFVKAATSHGTGCALSAALAANLAQGRPLLEAAVRAKAYVHHSLVSQCLMGEGMPARYTPEPRQGDTSVVRVERI